MKKFLSHLISFVAVCMLAVSCGDSNDNVETITEQALTNAFAYVTDIADGPAAYYNGIGYKVRLNYTKPSADVTVAGLKLTDGTEYPTFTLRDLKFSIDKDGWIVLVGENITPAVSGVATPPVVSSFSMRLYQRVVGERYSPAFAVNMTINHRFSVVSSFAKQTCYGTTKSEAEGMPAFETKSTIYDLDFNTETRCVNVNIQNAQFMDRMPAMNIVLKNIPFRIIGSKVYFDADNVTPESNNTPYPAFPISNLKGELDFGSGFDLDFNCAPVKFQGVVFEVSADCGFPVVENTI